MPSKPRNSLDKRSISHDQDIEWMRPPFFYTLDQIAGVLNLSIRALTERHIHKLSPDNKITKKPGPSKMIARDFGSGLQDDWRITDAEFKRWIEYMGFRPMSMREYF